MEPLADHANDALHALSELCRHIGCLSEPADPEMMPSLKLYLPIID